MANFHRDWNCSRCNFRNFGSRAKCKKCSLGTRPSNNRNNKNNQKRGDWTCNSCGFLNFKYRNQCKKCGENKNTKSNPSSSASSASSNKSLLTRSGDWKCSKCSFINHENQMQCEKCKTSKIDSNPKWFKTQFLYSGSSRMSDNDQYQTPKNMDNDNKYRRGRGKNKKGKDWECPQCKLSNFASREQCRKCKALKPKNTDNNNTEIKNNNDDDVEMKKNKVEFAKNSFATVGSGGIISTITSSGSTEKYGLFVSWHVGVSEGRGQALFEGEESALLAVKKLKNSTFVNNTHLRIKDPIPFNGRDGVYKAVLSNIPRNFDDEMLTHSLAKLSLENFIEAHVFMKEVTYSSATDTTLSMKSLNTLFSKYNVNDIKLHPAKFGIAKAILSFNKMSDALNAITDLNNRSIEFGVKNGKLSVRLDLRIVIELEQFVYDILRPEIEKLMYVIRRDPARFFSIKVFLFGIAKSATNKARIVICGNDSKGICLARALYENLTSPLILKFEDEYKCKLVSNYLTKSGHFNDFKCCLVDTLININTIRIYGRSEIRAAFKNAVEKFNKNVVYYDIKVTPLFIRSLRQKDKQDILKQFEKSQVYVNMDVTKRLVQVIYCKEITKPDHIEKGSGGGDNHDNDDNDNNNDANKLNTEQRAKECINYINQLIEENEKATKMGGNETKQKGDNDNAAICGVCFMEIEENECFYKLRICGHSFHSDCILMQLNSACQVRGTRPICCASCNGNISLLDIQDIINSDEKYKQILLFSTSDFIDTHPNEYKHCPTPDCKQIYFINNKDNGDNKDDENKNNDNIDDNIFNCTECMKQYCLNCNVDYHFGLTCDAYKASKDTDKSLEIFLKEYKADSDTQRCPNCSTITDKLKNTCNHATCVYCNAHFCWKCLWMDKNDNRNGKWVYKHMQSAHGGYYG